MHVEENMKMLEIKLKKQRQTRITKQMVHSVSVNIRISQLLKVMLTNCIMLI